MKIYKLAKDKWYLERLLYLIAGVFVLFGVLLGINISNVFLYFTAFVGGMLIFFSVTGYCPIAIFLNKFGISGRINKENK